MTVALRVLWLVAVLAAIGNLAVRGSGALQFDADMMALLPSERQDPEFRSAAKALSTGFERRFVLLVGGETAHSAIAAAAAVDGAVKETGFAKREAVLSPADARSGLLDLYGPHARQLLSEDDRRRLEQGHGVDIAERGLAQIFSPASFVDATGIIEDPFQLLPAFLASLPPPPLRDARYVDGEMLYMDEGGREWVLLAYVLTAEPYALTAQRAISEALDGAVAATGGAPILRLGTVFFAQAGAETSLREMSLIGGISIASIVIMLVWVFRGIGPVWQSVFAIAIGILCALSCGMALFPRLHVVALLFGTSLIGTTVDYCMHYFCTEFGPRGGTPRSRLRHILPGLTLGVATTLIGYAALLLAPFPGLRQIAVISAVGIVASSLTVALWFPVLNRQDGNARRGLPLWLAGAVHRWARHARYAGIRRGMALVLVVAGIAGFLQLRVNDDIRSMQAPDAALLAEQASVRALTGLAPTLQYVLLAAANHETALVGEERLLPKLRMLRKEGAIDGYTMMSRFVSSQARQREDAILVRERLEGPFLGQHWARIGLPLESIPTREADTERFLTVPEASQALPFLKDLSVRVADGGLFHVVPLHGVRDVQAVRQALADMPKARLIDPVSNVNGLLAEYRGWAVGLLALSIALMFALLAWRYRPLAGVQAMFAPVAAVVLTPCLLALAGRGFSCFDAMALILVLAIGADYAIFCAEAPRAWRRVTLLAILLAALTSMLSFGLLAFSSNFAVASFGYTMLVGVLLSFLFAPVALQVRARGGSESST